MGFTVSSLTAYVDQTSKELLTALQFEQETAADANIQTGIKSAAALQILTNTPVPQDGSTCAFNASGNTAFTQRELATSAVKYQDTLCPRTLETKWTQVLLKKGQSYGEEAMLSDIVADVTKQIKRIQETADWLGDTTSVSSYLNRYDGLATLIKAATGTQTATAVAGPVTTSNVRTIVQNIISKIPAAQKGDAATKIYAGYDFVELYRQKMFIDNLYHFPANGDQKGIMAEGSVHELCPRHGLDGLGANSGDAPFVFAIDFSRNVFLGVDMDGEDDQFDVWESKDDQNIKYSVRFRRGWQIAFPAEIVEYSNT